MNVYNCCEVFIRNTEREAKNMNVRNDDVAQVVVEIPKGHRHIRTTVTLREGLSMTFQEATIAAVVRAYVSVKTHPTATRVCLEGKMPDKKKPGYADWQLVED